MNTLSTLLQAEEDKQKLMNELNPYSKDFDKVQTSPQRDYPLNAYINNLDEQIAKVKEQIATRDANRYNQPNTRVGWASYIIDNDRGLLDKYADAERAWYNKLKDQEHAKELAYAQMQHAKELANTQMEQQAAYRMDDNMKNRSLALNKLQYAEAALKNDTSNDPLIKAGLERDVRNAKEELKYWNKAVGLEDKEVSDTAINEIKEDVKEDVKDDRTTEVQITDYSSITKIKNQAEKDSILKEMERNPAIKKNAAFKEQYNRIKDITPEDKKAADKALRKNKWLEGKKLQGHAYKSWTVSPEGKALIKEFGE